MLVVVCEMMDPVAVMYVPASTARDEVENAS